MFVRVSIINYESTFWAYRRSKLPELATNDVEDDEMKQIVEGCPGVCGYDGCGEGSRLI